MKMINPILKREVTSKTRSWKFTGMITLYGLVLSFFSLIFFESINRGNNMINLNAINGIFISLIVFIYFIICFVSPALTSSSINSEKTSRTLDLLICAPISARKIIIGKILSSLVSVIYLLIVTMPLFSLLFMFGGLSILDILIFMLYFLLATLYYGSIGVLFSSLFNKIAVSTVMSYIVIFFLNIATMIISMGIPEIFNFSKDLKELFSYFMYLNPGYGLFIISSRTSSNMSGVSINAHSPLTGVIIIIAIEIVVIILLNALAIKKISPLKE
jgi:ABC-type transport system involved in multi-copper enzyme maturation permease subunit